jgi:allantoinase
MTVSDLIIRGRKVVLPEAVVPASIHIEGGRITSVDAYDEVEPNCEVIEADEESVVMPGLVDTHVHINEPGRTNWEGFRTATLAAAAGGVTTLVDMPLNSIPPTTTLAGFKSKLEAARGNCHVDLGFWGGVVPGNTGELAGMLDAGVVGFKCFLVPSGVDEFPHVTEEHLREAMPELARLGALLIVHAELPGPIEMAGIPGGPLSPDLTVTNVGSTAYKTFLASRPREAENQAIEMMIRLSREFDTHVHIVHLSSAEALPMLRAAIASGVRITAETCPHYLYFAAEEIHDGATEFKCCPPIRERENREELWEALAHGTLDVVVSDHSPCPSDMKLSESGDFLAAWGGISSLQLRLPVVWTEAYQRGFSFLDISRWLCNAPARLVELKKRKGVIAAGRDADIVIWDPTQEFKVEPNMLQHRHKLTPYQGETLRGVVQKTFLRGKKVYDNGEYLRLSQGLFLLRTSGAVGSLN